MSDISRCLSLLIQHKDRHLKFILKIIDRIEFTTYYDDLIKTENLLNQDFSELRNDGGCSVL